eukprot:413059_1
MVALLIYFHFKMIQKANFILYYIIIWTISCMQQKAPHQDKIKITKKNINQLFLDCMYESENGVAFMGYPTIVWRSYDKSIILNNYQSLTMVIKDFSLLCSRSASK